MSDQDSRLILSVGKHASATDFSATPGTLKHLLSEKWGFRSPGRIILPRSPAHPSNKRFPGSAGPIDISKAHELEMIIRGLSGNAGGAIDPETTCDIAEILDVVFGTDSVDPTGAVTTATGGTPASKLLGVTLMERFPVGSCVWFQAPIGTWHARQVRARAGASGAGDLTLDRIWTGAVAIAADVIRFARWKDDPSVHEHTHAFFRAEWAGDDDRRDYRGGMSRGVFDFTIGQHAMLKTSWMFTDVANDVDLNPTFTEPTTGSPLVNVNNSFWVADQALYATDMSAELGGTRSARRANSGPQGVQGYRVMKGGDAPKTRIMVTLQRGDSTGEVSDNGASPAFRDLQALAKNPGETLEGFDIAFQVGGVTGGVGYFPVPNAECVEAEEVIVDGAKHIKCVFECNTPSDSALFPFECHLG